MKDTVLKYALKNALDFGGKVNSNVVLGAVLKENPDLRKDVPALRKEIDKAVEEVAKLKLPEIQKKIKLLAPELLKEKKEEVEGPLKPLPDAKIGKVIVRIAPSPSGPLHIGHAYGTSLNYEYAKMYKGKFLLRIEDTNPENINTPAYEMIPDDANWLTNNGVNEIIIQSSRLGIYYDYAEKLVQIGKAYVCTCNSEKWIEMKNQGEACKCRSLSIKENALRFAKLFNEYAEGEAVLRLKTDIKDKNPAMRDFAIMRIVEHVHPKTGKEQRVWPLMLFSVAIDDHELGITHVLNGKDHADNAKKEQIVMEFLGWKPPIYKHWGRINFEGFELSTSKTRRAIDAGEYSGWDDIRLPFLRALRKRGYQPEAFRKFALEVGISLNDKAVTLEEFWKNINSFNREIVEPKSNRYFFVDQPQRIKVEKAPTKTAKLDLHPEHPERGKRELLANGEVYICKSDVEKLDEKKIHRLMDYCNFTIEKGKYKFHSEDYESFKEAKNKGFIIHWLPITTTLEVEVHKEDGTIDRGLGEEGLRELIANQIVQLERRYFATLQNKAKNKLIFWHLHK